MHILHFFEKILTQYENKVLKMRLKIRISIKNQIS